MALQLAGCCMQYKKIVATKGKCGHNGFQDSSNVYLNMTSSQAIGGNCGPGCSYSVNYDRQTCVPTGTPCGDNYVCCEPTTEVTSDTYKRVYKQYTEDCFCCEGKEDFFDQDTYTLSNLYDKSMLEGDVSSLKAGVSWSELEWGQCAYPEFSGGGITPNIYDCSGVAFVEHYADGDDPGYIQKSWLQFVATGSKYCKVTYPQDGSGSCLRELISCSAGSEVTVEPPDQPGFSYIYQCCSPEICG